MGGLLLASNERDDACPSGGGELYACGAESAGGAGDEHRLTFPELSATDHRVVCGVRWDDESGCVDIVERVGCGRHARGDCDSDVCEAPPGLDEDAHDARADEVLELARRVTHDADALLARDVWTRDRNWIRASRHCHIGERQRRGAHVHDHPIGGYRVRRLVERHPAAHAHPHPREARGRRLVDILLDEHVRRLPELVNPPGAHRSTSAVVDGARPERMVVPRRRTANIPEGARHGVILAHDGRRRQPAGVTGR